MTDQESTPSGPSGRTPNSNVADRADPGAPKRGRRRFWRRALLALLLVIVAGGGIAFYLVRSEPAHWKRHQAFLKSTSPQEIKAIAKRVDDRMTALISLAEEFEAEQLADTLLGTDGQASTAAEALLAKEAQQGATDQTQAGDQPAAWKPLIRQVKMTPEEANVWLAEKIHEWMSYRDYVMPKNIADPMIAVTDEQLLLSFAIKTSAFSQVFTAGFDIDFREDGNASLKLRNVKAGSLPLPVDGIGNYIRSQAPDSGAARKAANWLDKLDGVEFKPSMKLGKKHKAQVTDYAVVEGGIAMTVRVEKRPTYVKPQAQQTTAVAAAE